MGRECRPYPAMSTPSTRDFIQGSNTPLSPFSRARDFQFSPAHDRNFPGLNINQTGSFDYFTGWAAAFLPQFGGFQSSPFYIADYDFSIRGEDGPFPGPAPVGDGYFVSGVPLVPANADVTFGNPYTTFSSPQWGRFYNGSANAIFQTTAFQPPGKWSITTDVQAPATTIGTVKVYADAGGTGSVLMGTLDAGSLPLDPLFEIRRKTITFLLDTKVHFSEWVYWRLRIEMTGASGDISGYQWSRVQINPPGAPTVYTVLNSGSSWAPHGQDRDSPDYTTPGSVGTILISGSNAIPNCQINVSGVKVG